MSHSNLRNILFPVYSSSILKGNKEFKSKGVCTLSLYLGTNENSFLKKKKKKTTTTKKKTKWEQRSRTMSLVFQAAEESSRHVCYQFMVFDFYINRRAGSCPLLRESIIHFKFKTISNTNSCIHMLLKMFLAIQRINLC